MKHLEPDSKPRRCEIKNIGQLPWNDWGFLSIGDIWWAADLKHLAWPGSR